MKDIPQVSLDKCVWNKQARRLSLHAFFIGMPHHFFVRSHHTGKEIRFVVVGEHDKLFDQDQWDGEQQIYRPTHPVPFVDHLIIHRGIL